MVTNNSLNNECTSDFTVTTGNLLLDNTNSAGTTGNIQFGGNRVISNISTNNFFAGNAAGNLALTGAENVGIGEFALTNLTVGTDNVSIGEACLQTATNTDFNVAIGPYSMQNFDNDLGNVCVGYYAMNTATGGNVNVALGSGALNNIVNGSGNVAIGFVSGTNYTGAETNNITIGTQVSGTTGESTTIRLGNVGVHTACYIAGIAGVAVSNVNYVTIDTGISQLGSVALGTQVRGQASSVGVSSNTPTDITSILLTPGNWNISCLAQADATGGVSNAFQIGISTTSGSFAGLTEGDNLLAYTPTVGGTFTSFGLSIPDYYVSVISNTTFYLEGQVTIVSGTASVSGRISATQVG